MKTEDVNVDVLILINRAIKVLMDIGCNDDQVKKIADNISSLSDDNKIDNARHIINEIEKGNDRDYNLFQIGITCGQCHFFIERGDNRYCYQTSEKSDEKITFNIKDRKDWCGEWQNKDNKQ